MMTLCRCFGAVRDTISVPLLVYTDNVADSPPTTIVVMELNFRFLKSSTGTKQQFTNKGNKWSIFENMIPCNIDRKVVHQVHEIYIYATLWNGVEWLTSEDVYLGVRNYWKTHRYQQDTIMQDIIGLSVSITYISMNCIPKLSAMPWILIAAISKVPWFTWPYINNNICNCFRYLYIEVFHFARKATVIKIWNTNGFVSLLKFVSCLN